MNSQEVEPIKEETIPKFNIPIISNNTVKTHNQCKFKKIIPILQQLPNLTKIDLAMLKSYA